MRRAVRRGVAVAAGMLLLLLGAVAVLHVVDDEAEPTHGRAELEEHLDQHPGVAMLLPVRLPPGYDWRGVQDWTRERGTVTQRGTTFVPGEAGTGEPLVSLCVEEAAPPRQCPRNGAGMRRSVAGHRVVITFDTSRPTAEQWEFWQSVPLRANPGRINWLDE